MIVALISGSLFRAPATRTTKTGKPFVVATVKVADATSTTFVKVFAWSDHAREELDGLGDGDAVSVVGELRGEIYTPAGGEPRISLSIHADKVLALKKPERCKKAKDPAPPAENPNGG